MLNMYQDKLANLYEGMTEHEHQRELFSWAACAQRYGIEESLMWVLQEPRTIKRDNGRLRGLLTDRGDSRLVWLHSIPNSGHGKKGTAGAVRGARMKAEGLKPGVADVFLPLPCGGYHGLYLELKKAGGRLQPEQREFADYVREQGYSWFVATGYWDAIHTILCYLGEKQIVMKYFG